MKMCAASMERKSLGNQVFSPTFEEKGVCVEGKDILGQSMNVAKYLRAREAVLKADWLESVD